MYYLQVEHVEDDDFDYNRYKTLERALEDICEGYRWVLSSEPVGLPESEYTDIE